MSAAHDRRLKILVVDDEEHAVSLLTRILSSEFNILAARSGEDALSLLRANPDVAVVITDQRMPGLKGVDVLRESVKIAPNAIRVIVSAFADPDELLDAINEGNVNRYVVKPVEPSRLIATIRDALGAHRLILEWRGKMKDEA